MQNRARLLKQYQTHLKKQPAILWKAMLKAEGRYASIIGADKTASRMVSCAAQGERQTRQALAENNHFLSSNHLHNITKWRFTAWNSNLASLMSGGARA